MARKTEQLQIRVTKAEKAELKRRAREAGVDVSAYVLERVLPPEGDRFGQLVAGLQGEHHEDPRFVLAELNDLLVSLNPVELSAATSAADLTGLRPLHQNYVAAMVELASSNAGVQPPPWTAEVRPLEVPWFATSMASLRPHLLKEAPVPFKRRNLFIDSSLGSRV